MSPFHKAQLSGGATVVAAPRKRDMTRVETAQYINDHWFPYSPKTLAKLAVIGGVHRSGRPAACPCTARRQLTRGLKARSVRSSIPPLNKRSILARSSLPARLQRRKQQSLVAIASRPLRVEYGIREHAQEGRSRTRLSAAETTY